jgi:CRISPR-associated protein Cas6/Cse3/CasE subtype I-E
VFSEIFLVDDPKPLSNLSFRSGQKLSFRLTANPTKIVTEQTVEKRKVRVPLIKLDQREDWLKRHLEGCVIIESVVSQNETPLYFSRGNKGGKVVPVLFQGILTVLKPDGFMEQIYKKFDKDGSYIAGLGPAKSFGCGLMLIKPV